RYPAGRDQEAAPVRRRAAEGSDRMTADGTPRRDLENEANQARSRLMQTVEQLDRRGIELSTLRVRLRHALRDVVVAGGGGVLPVLVLTVGAVAFAVQRASAAVERRRGRRGGRRRRGGWRSPRRLFAR